MESPDDTGQWRRVGRHRWHTNDELDATLTQSLTVTDGDHDSESEHDSDERVCPEDGPFYPEFDVEAVERFLESVSESSAPATVRLSIRGRTVRVSADGCVDVRADPSPSAHASE
jgi:hypothetical protein